MFARGRFDDKSAAFYRPLKALRFENRFSVLDIDDFVIVVSMAGFALFLDIFFGQRVRNIEHKKFRVSDLARKFHVRGIDDLLCPLFHLFPLS